MVDVIEILVPGGKASPGPPIGPALGPLGINIKSVVDEINEKTASYNGMQVPVKVTVDDKKKCDARNRHTSGISSYSYRSRYRERIVWRRHGGQYQRLSLIHISEPTRQAEISYAVFCLKKK